MLCHRSLRLTGGVGGLKLDVIEAVVQQCGIESGRLARACSVGVNTVIALRFETRSAGANLRLFLQVPVHSSCPR
jgi:hypothetical protein